MTKVVREMSKLFGLFFLLFSLNVSASTDIFTCKLDAKKSRGWIPSNLVISFVNDGGKAEINYGHKSNNIKVIRYSGRLKEVTALIAMKGSNGKTSGTKHNITILNNRDITYVFNHTGSSRRLTARGKCTAKQIKLNASSPEKVSGNSPQSALTARCGTNASMCTRTQVCEMATYVTGNKRKWKTTASSTQYVQKAFQLGLSCEVMRSGAAAVTNKAQVKAPQAKTPSAELKSQTLYAAHKRACADIGFVVGTTEFASCVLQLVTLQSGKAAQKNSKPTTTQRPSYSNAIRICESEGDAGASSTYKSITPSTSSYKSNCRSTGYNSVNCNTTGGVNHDGGFSNFANTVSRNQSSYRIFEACMLKYGYEPPKRNVLQKIFGIK